MGYGIIQWNWARMLTTIDGVRIAMRGWFGLSLGTRVRWKGELWYCANGIYEKSWLIRKVSDHSIARKVPTSELRKVLTPCNYWRGVVGRWRWWRSSWYHIHLGRRLGEPGAVYRRNQ